MRAQPRDPGGWLRGGRGLGGVGRVGAAGLAVRSATLGEAWLPEVLFESGWDREKGVGGPGRLHPRLHCLTARLFNSQLLAGAGRASASRVPELLLAPRARAQGGGSSRFS